MVAWQPDDLGQSRAEVRWLEGGLQWTCKLLGSQCPTKSHAGRWSACPVGPAAPRRATTISHSQPVWATAWRPSRTVPLPCHTAGPCAAAVGPSLSSPGGPDAGTCPAERVSALCRVILPRSAHMVRQSSQPTCSRPSRPRLTLPSAPRQAVRSLRRMRGAPRVRGPLRMFFDPSRRQRRLAHSPGAQGLFGPCQRFQCTVEAGRCHGAHEAVEDATWSCGQSESRSPRT
jgi:hypothetical protein